MWTLCLHFVSRIMLLLIFCFLLSLPVLFPSFWNGFLSMLVFGYKKMFLYSMWSSSLYVIWIVQSSVLCLLCGFWFKWKFAFTWTEVLLFKVVHPFNQVISQLATRVLTWILMKKNPKKLKEIFLETISFAQVNRVGLSISPAPVTLHHELTLQCLQKWSHCTGRWSGRVVFATFSAADPNCKSIFQRYYRARWWQTVQPFGKKNEGNRGLFLQTLTNLLHRALA